MNQQPKIYFAPFQGITTLTFRRIYAHHFSGVDKLFTPYFINITTSDKSFSKKMIELKNQFENGIEVIPQILSRNADEIIEFGHKCQQLGFKEINWNLGCPHPQVVNKKLGSGLLQYPDIVNSILDNVISNIDIPFSIKCRLGYFSINELADLVPIFNSFPISEITIHARLGKQLYSGQTDMEAFSRIAPQLNSPPVYNGDIFNMNDFTKFKDLFPDVNRIMLGRGTLTDPFLPARIKGLDLPVNPKEHLRMFIDDLYIAYRKDKNDQLSLLSALKEYWTYFANTFDEPIQVFRKLKKCKTFDSYEDAVNRIFVEHNLIINA